MKRSLTPYKVPGPILNPAPGKPPFMHALPAGCIRSINSKKWIFDENNFIWYNVIELFFVPD